MSAQTEHRGGRLSPLALVPVVIFAGLGAAFYWGLFNGDDRLPSTLIDKPVPEFAMPPVEGRSDGLATADLLGEVSIVNVWASWCVPCRVEMPLLVELAGTNTVAINGINYKDDPDAALGFLAELGDPYTRIGADRNGRVSIDWGVYGLPETFVVDAEGRIAYKYVGPFDRKMLDEDILPVVRRLQAPGGT
jgi:cytochrome c biogenesis protein CcmG/thiol:disulfide interchange protein DsbE